MAKTVLGLDIGTRFIKFVELAHLGHDKFELLGAGMAPAPIKGLNSDSNIDHESLAVSIKNLLREGKVRNKIVNIALAEASVYTRVVQVPPLTERELASAIKWEAEQYIPKPLNEVQMDFSIIGESKDAEGVKKLDVLLVAAPLVLIERYKKILKLCDLDINALETEIISASRSLLPPTFDKPLTLMVINLGALTTDFSIIRKGVISFTRSLPTGGASFTKAISQDLGFPTPQAEEFKKTYGLDEAKLEGKIFRSLKPIFMVISEEVKRSITYFLNKFPDEVISTIILSGGSARLPKLVEKIAEATGIETQVGGPWSRVHADPTRFSKLNDEAAVFVVATGLAMRED